MSEQNKAVARRMVEDVINKRNLALVDELVAPDYTYYEPTVGAVHGRDNFKKLVGMYLNAFPDLRITVDQQIAEGDTVVTRWTAEGTHRGELLGISPTGRYAKVQGVIIGRYQNGQIVEDFESYDVLGMLQQLGVVKPLSKALAA